MQNLCKNLDLAAEAVRGGAHHVLEGLLCGAAGAEDPSTKHFAAGTLGHLEAMLSPAPKRRGRRDVRPAPPAARARAGLAPAGQAEGDAVLIPDR